MAFVYEDPPCTLEEILHLSFSFDNLQKFLNTITNNNREFFLKISDIFLRLDQIDILKNDINKLSGRISNNEQNIISLDRNIDAHKKLFEENAIRFSNQESVIHIFI